MLSSSSGVVGRVELEVGVVQAVSNRQGFEFSKDVVNVVDGGGSMVISALNF